MDAQKYFDSQAEYNKWLKQLTEDEKGHIVEMLNDFHQQLLQQTQCKTHVCHHCGGVDGHTIECTAWAGKTVTV